MKDLSDPISMPGIKKNDDKIVVVHEFIFFKRTHNDMRSAHSLCANHTHMIINLSQIRGKPTEEALPWGSRKIYRIRWIMIVGEAQVVICCCILEVL